MDNPYIIGKQIYLRHPTEEDALGKWHEWFSDEELTKHMNDRYFAYEYTIPDSPGYCWKGLDPCGLHIYVLARAAQYQMI